MTRLHCLGIRHHGPGSARSVSRALDDLRPAVVAVEIPADLEPLLMGLDGLVPPVALLGAERDRPDGAGSAVFLPLAAFSPEWQAIQWAAANGVPVVAIDLPLATWLAAPAGTRRPGVGPDPLALLASAAGEPDAERWWEDVVEHRGDGIPAFTAIEEAMTAVRDEAGSVDGVLDQWREAHMRRAIRAAASRVPETLVEEAVVAVVCGAWHVPALVGCLTPRATPTQSDDTRLLRGLPTTRIVASWVPWTHQRLASASGYGAGVESPGWYQHVFEHPGPEGAERWFVSMARLMRARDLAASPDHVIAASRAAEALAALRGRPRAGLAEILDATEAVMAHGPARGLVEREMVVGDAIGTVPVSAVQAPLLRDLGLQQKACRLTPSTDARVLELDLRSDAGRRRSVLLHRLRALGVPWGTEEAGRGTTGTFRETWSLRWDPEFAVRLVERSAAGATVAVAAARTLEERAVGADLPRRVELLEAALRADLPEVVGVLADSVATASASAPDVAELIDSLRPLARTLRYGDVRGTDTVALRSVFDALVARVLAGLAPACRGLADEPAAEMAERLSSIDAALALVQHPARTGQWPAAVRILAERSDVHGVVQGRAMRLLHEAGVWGRREIAVRLARILSPGTAPERAAHAVEGLLAGSGSLLVHDAELLAVLDDWMMALHPDLFLESVPLLRRTFATFLPAERRQIASLAVLGPAAAPVGAPGDAWDVAQAARALRVVRQMLGAP